MSRDIVLEVVYPHPPELVWQALTDPKALANWLMANDFEPRVGHRFRFRTEPRPGFDGIVHCEVTEVDPPRRLAYTWSSGFHPAPTLVAFTLEPVADGTRLRLEHTGFAGFRGLALRFILGRGWKGNILRGSLPRELDRLRAASAEATAPAVPSPRADDPAGSTDQT